MGGRKIAMIDDADYLNAEGANALLKTLEEPPPRSVLILIGTSPAKQLPTIRSRCQLIRFQPLGEDHRGRVAVGEGIGQMRPKPGDWPITATGACNGRGTCRPGSMDLSQHALRAVGGRGRSITSPSRPTVAAVRRCGRQGSASARRQRLQQIVHSPPISIATCSAHSPAPAESADADLRQCLETALRARADRRETTAKRLDRCLDADRQIDRNANQSTLIEAWLDGLAAEKGKGSGSGEWESGW